jgi:multiple sugar transport system permease protein
LFLHARIPGRGVIRALMLMPLMMPPVITALMWKIMMASTNAGILNYLL